MREETKVFLEMVAKKRSEHILKATPGVEIKLAMDDSGLRCALQVFKDGELERLEFIESESTAGNVKYFDDYIGIAKSMGILVLLFPESKYSRDLASAIYQSIMSEVRKRAERKVSFQGFVFDDRGNSKKVGWLFHHADSNPNGRADGEARPFGEGVQQDQRFVRSSAQMPDKGRPKKLGARQVLSVQLDPAGYEGEVLVKLVLQQSRIWL